MITTTTGRMQWGCGDGGGGYVRGGDRCGSHGGDGRACPLLLR